MKKGIVWPVVLGAGVVLVVGIVVWSSQERLKLPDPTETNKINDTQYTKGEWLVETEKGDDQFVNLLIVNQETGEKRVIGSVFLTVISEKGVDFSGDGEKVVFIEQGNNIEQGIAVYSIADGKVTDRINLSAIKRNLPDIVIPRNASLHRVFLSSSGNKLAVNYGYTLEADYGSDIIVVDLSTGRIVDLKVKGLVQGWKDEAAVLYEQETDQYTEESLYPKRIIREARIVL